MTSGYRYIWGAYGPHGPFPQAQGGYFPPKTAINNPDYVRHLSIEPCELGGKPVFRIYYRGWDTGRYGYSESRARRLALQKRHKILQAYDLHHYESLPGER